MAVEIKSYNQILGGMVKKILADTALSDLRVGSVISSILESAAQSDFEIHASIVQLIQLFSIDTTGGADLDSRAAEFNVIRQTAKAASGFVTLGDKNVTKKSSKIYIGLPPPVVGDTAINVEDASSFTPTGSVYIGRGTGNYEGPLAYTSIVNNTSYWTINLASPVTKNHTAVETVILAQGGNRNVPAGIIVRSPANNFSPAVGFVITRAVTIVDGENTLDNVPVTAQTPGTIGNVPAGAITQFTAPPFAGATVTNLANFNNGQDVELDSSLRARIRNAIQLIARGTKQSILQAVAGVSDSTDNKRVVSASLAEPVNPTVPAQLYIDDGTGFEPSFAGQGVEDIVDSAAGSEQLIQVSNFPITPPILVSALDEPFAVFPGMTLDIQVDTSQEELTILAGDIAVPGLARAAELIDAVNARSTLVTARSVRNKVGVALVAKRFSDGTDPEQMQIIGGTANDSIKFPVTISRVMSLYKNGALLKKNAESAVVYSTVSTTWEFGISTVAAVLQILIDNTPVQSVIFRDSDFSSFGTTYKTASADQWSTVIASKVAGLNVLVQTSQLRFASNKANSSDSRVQIQLATDLSARGTTAAVWKSGTTVRYSVADTTNIVVGDSVAITGFSNADNNGVFVVTNIAPHDYVEVTSGRVSNAHDETSVVGAFINPNKEDLALVMFGAAEDVSGAGSDYILNRFSGEIQLATKLTAGDNVTAGSQFTSAHVDSLASVSPTYNFPIQQDITPEFLVSFDSNSAVRTLLVAVGDVITQGRVSGQPDQVTLSSNRTNAFENVVAGDFLFVVTRSVSGIGVGYSAWFPSYATGTVEVLSVTNPQTIVVRNPDPTFPAYPGTITGTVSATDDLQSFTTDGLVQRVPLSGVNLLPSAVVAQINSAVEFGHALVFNNQTVRLQSNSLDEIKSKVFILAVAGTGKNIYLAGTSALATQPHIGFQLAGAEETSFPRLKDGLSSLLGGGLARSMIFGETTSSSLTQPYHHIDSTKTFVADIQVDDVIRYQSGINNQEMLALRSIDSNTQLTPQTYGAINPIYIHDKYEITESQKFSPSDKLIIELDQNPTNETFLVPMYRTGRVEGIATTTTFDAFDMDSASGTDFNNAIWQTYSFQDFALMFRSRNIYKAGSSDSSLIIRSAVFGAVGDKITFGVFYPTAPLQAAYAIHTIHNGSTDVQFYLPSGAARVGISNVGAGYEVSRSGNILTLTWTGIGPNPNFSGNGVLVGDIASITDPSFGQKSTFIIGSGKVTAVSSSSISIRLQGSATVGTTYSITSSTDSGAGVTTTYAMPATGLIAVGDLLTVSGFTRTINNGTFTVVGVNANTNVTVQHSNRTTITQATSGYRRTSNVVLLQFANTIAGQVFTGDSIVISGMAEPTLDGTWTVSNILTTTFANDTIQFTAAGIDLPIAEALTNAIWQSGTTVRFAATNTTGITAGNFIVVAGFVNSDNNGTFQVTNVSVNNWIECNTTRTTNAHDETHAGTARPTYFVTDSGGTVVVINNETHAATGNLIIVQSTARGISAFPLGSTTAAAMAAVINANPIVSSEITAVNALGYNGTGVISNATFDEPSSVGYNHTAGQATISLYDGSNFVLDFYSATINVNKNFSLKKALQFSHADYNISTAPNITGEQPGEYFKLVPTTFRNLESWFNKASITSFSILGTAGATADGGKIQLASQTIGTDGAVKVSGGGANGIASFVKIPASIDSGSIRLQVNKSDAAMFAVGQIVEVSNGKASRKANNFAAGNQIDVQNVNGTTGRFVSRARSISLANTNSVTITDVSASYGRTSGIIWRWTATGTPAAPFIGTVVGDAFQTTNANLNAGNKTSTATGDGATSFFPIVGVDVSGNYIDVQNPNGVAQGPVAISGTLATTVSPAFFTEWKHSLHVADVMKVEAIQTRNFFRISWVSGTTNPKFASNGVSVDDYVVISGNTFLPQNRGTFRVVAVDDAYFVVENPNGVPEISDSIDQSTDIRFFYSESVIVGDNLNISDLVFLPPNRGLFATINYGTDPTLKTQYVTVTITNSSAQTGVSLTGLPNTFFVTDGQLYSSYRHVTNFGSDPSDAQSAIVYLQPAMNSTKMSNAFNTSITPIQKLSYSSDTAIGVDGYRYYTGLLRTVQKVVDGYDPDPVNFPGYKAAGTQIETVPPLINRISVNVVVKPSGGIALSALSDGIKAAILNYINGLGVGESVIVSEITAAVMSVEGVLSSTLFNPSPTTTSIVILDNQKAVININDITVSSG